jgi:malonyl-CoA O-methyltransferase
MHYDTYARVQRAAAAALCALTGPRAAASILELGCGTGLYTRQLLAAFPTARIQAIDASSGMIAHARRGIDTEGRVNFQVADVGNFPAGSFDLITSNATLQWVPELSECLAQVAKALAPAGQLTFSYFGPETYGELDAAVQAVCGDTVRATAVRFASAESLMQTLAARFPRWALIERRYVESYPSVRDLLRAIRYTGTRGAGSAYHWTPHTLARVEEAYRAQSGGIRATCQLFFVKAEL